jgi:glycosyltransferase involved in cell wall biosynthesis
MDHKHSIASVLYLSYDGLTDQLGQSQILPYLIGLSKKGYSVTVVSFEKKDRYKEGKERIENLCIASRLSWVPLPYHKSPPIFSTLYDILVLRRKTKELNKKKRFEIVHCRSYITAMVGRWLKKKYSLRFIFDMRGFWADERVEGGLWNVKNPIFKFIYKFFKNLERALIKEADSVIVLTESARTEIQSWDLNPFITTIPCCVELSLFNPNRYSANDRESVRNTLGVTKKDYLLLYLGSLGTWYLYEEMVSFFRRLKAYRPEAKFLFLTPDVERVKKDSDFILKTVPRSEVPLYIDASDASICFIKPSFSKKGSSATKMAEVIAMGLPVVTNPNWGDIAFLKQQLGQLFVWDIEDPNEEIIPLLLQKGRELNCNEFFINFFSLEKGVEKYDTVYTHLLSK